MPSTFKGVIHVSGRRWFHKGPGNTYHSAIVTMPDGEQLSSGIHYGYGSEFEYTAFALVAEKLGFSTRYENGNPKAPWRWAEENGYKWIVNCVDVSRKKDL